MDMMNTGKMPGGCFREALINAQISIPDDLCLPDWIQIEDIPTICTKLGVKWYGGPQDITLDVEPVIVLYRTSPKRGHAIFTLDIGPLIGNVSIIGVIKIRKEIEQ